MGLISTIGNLGTTAANIGQGIEDLIGAAKNSIFGMQDNVKQENPMSGYSTIEQNQFEPSKFFDLRGRECVFRGKENTYNTNSFKNHFDMDSDFYWYDTAYQGQLWNEIKPKIPKIYIHEFQPYQQSFLGQLANFAKNVSSYIDSIQEQRRRQEQLEVGEGYVFNPPSLYQQISTDFKIGFNQLLKDTPLLKQAGIFLGNEAIADISKNPSKLYDKNGLFSSVALINPTAAVNKMFLDGVWLHTYTIPLLSKQQFQLIASMPMFAALDGGGSLKQLLTNLVPSTKEKSADKKLNNMFSTIPSTPAFTPKLSARNKISTEFYLINKNSVYLVRNYRFLMAFAAGTMSVQMSFGKMHSPNVYYVEIPGKRQMVWSQIDVQVAQVGKYRSDEYATQQIYQETGSIAIKYARSYNSYNSHKILWPEAWKITVNITDFTPNTFNTFEHYLTYGSSLTDLQNQGGISENYTESIAQEKEKVGDQNVLDVLNDDDDLSEIGY